jgi:hypothetical protein
MLGIPILVWVIFLILGVFVCIAIGVIIEETINLFRRQGD